MELVLEVNGSIIGKRFFVDIWLFFVISLRVFGDFEVRKTKKGLFIIKLIFQLNGKCLKKSLKIFPKMFKLFKMNLGGLHKGL